MRAAWMAQELLSTFEAELGSVTLRPSQVNGRYEIFLDDSSLFDRKREGRFPEIKELKQLVRDKIAPDKNLGHSDQKPMPN